MSLHEFDFRRLHFCSPANPDRRWVDWFCEEFSRQNFNVEVTPLGGAPLRIDGVTRMLPDAAVYRGKSSFMRSVNTRASAAGDDAVLLIPCAGDDMSITFGGRSLVLSAGTCLLGGEDMVGTLDIPSTSELMTLRLRRKLLEPLVPHLSDRQRRLVQPNSQALNFLLKYLRMLDDEESISSPEMRHTVSTHLHELAALVFKCEGEDYPLSEALGVRAGRLASIKADILDHLADARLSVGFIAARQRVTPRYVHMLFAAEGMSFTEFVLEHRLVRVRRMLTDSRYAHLGIGEIALRAGFNDLSYFNRKFRLRYGGTPSDIRADGRGFA